MFVCSVPVLHMKIGGLSRCGVKSLNAGQRFIIRESPRCRAFLHTARTDCGSHCLQISLSYQLDHTNTPSPETNAAIQGGERVQF